MQISPIQNYLNAINAFSNDISSFERHKDTIKDLVKKLEKTNNSNIQEKVADLKTKLEKFKPGDAEQFREIKAKLAEINQEVLPLPFKMPMDAFRQSISKSDIQSILNFSQASQEIHRRVGESDLEFLGVLERKAKKMHIAPETLKEIAEALKSKQLEADRKEADDISFKIAVLQAAIVQELDVRIEFGKLLPGYDQFLQQNSPVPKSKFELVEKLENWIRHDLQNLTQLFLNNKNIRKLPTQMWLPNLNTLTLEGNNLTTLPNWILQSTSLVHVDLTNNQLTKFPALESQALRYLYVDRNQISSIPVEFNLFRLETFLHRGNPWDEATKVRINAFEVERFPLENLLEPLMEGDTPPLPPDEPREL